MLPHLTLADVDSRAADVAAGIDAAEMELRQTLLAGGDTGSIRKFLTAQRTLQAELGEARAELVASIGDAEEQNVAAAGERLANDVAARLRDRLAPLQPPAPAAR
jgi:hypothetical protein